jgi:hypothetical protein
LTFAPSSWSEDFHLGDIEHARRTKKKAHRLQSAGLVKLMQVPLA